MLKVERAHSHTVIRRQGWLAFPQAVYIHAHEEGEEAHEHERLVRLDAVLVKVEQEAQRGC